MKAAAIIVIEDDPTIREQLIEILSQEGYVVLSAENGAKGLELIRSADSPCLLMVDLMMPVMNGWELLQNIKNEKALLDAGHRVMILSASVDAASTASKEGALFIRKPLDLKSLLERVAEQCSPI